MADFAEWLVAQWFGGNLVKSQFNRSFDVVTGDDRRIDVKSISKSRGNVNGYIIKDSDRKNDPSVGATHYVFVYFDELIPAAFYQVDGRFFWTFKKRQLRRSDLVNVSQIDTGDWLDIFRSTRVLTR